MGYQDLPTRDTLTLKKWIVLLLVLSCVTTLFLFISYSPDSQKQLKSAAQLDSLIQVNFDRFNINASQFRTHTISIDSLNHRKIFYVRVPPELSKTRWHYEIDKLVRPYGVSTPARVIFPEQNMQIYLAYNYNIVRTIELRTDTSLANQINMRNIVPGSDPVEVYRQNFTAK